MLSAYPACFVKENIGYSVIFPDLNDLATCGETLDEAFAMAVDCLAGYLYTCQQDGDHIPKPSRLSDINLSAIIEELELDPSIQEESFINIVTVDVAEYAKNHFEKTVKKTLTIPTWLNNAALEQDINFSQVLQEALKSQLHLG